MAAVPFRFDLHAGSDGDVGWRIVNLMTARAPLLRSVAAGARLAGGGCRVVEAGYPVSIKGVLIREGRVVLLHNERDECELPGGRIEPGETPEQTVAREIAEESGLPIEVDEILDVWVYHIAVAAKDVFIVTYGCTTTSSAAPVLSHEHSRIGEFLEDEVSELPMPEGTSGRSPPGSTGSAPGKRPGSVPRSGPLSTLCHQQRRGQAVSAGGEVGK